MGLLYRKGSRAAPAQKIERELTIMNRLGLHARPQGSKLRIRCDGPDADKAMEELEELVKAGFNED